MKKKNRSRICLNFVFFVAAFSAKNIVIGQHVISTRSPVVINHQAGSDGEVDNYFGFSLAYINDSRSFWGNSRQNSGSQRTYGTLFIGAPNEKRLTRNSGVIWGCRFGANSELACSLISSISSQATASDTTSYQRCSDRRLYDEKEEEQWIGDNLSVKDGQLIACAPRWKLNGYRYSERCRQETALLGGCYVAGSSENAALKAPLRNRQTEFNYIKPSKGGGQETGYWLVYSQLGFSSHVSNLPPNQKLFVGSPSARSWTGNFAEYDYNRETLRFYNKDGEMSDVKDYSYLGYSITSGNLFRYGQFIAVGAPRAEKLRGIVLLRYLTSSSPKIIVGEQFGGYFGYALATADLNGDGNDELLVGAPWQTGNSDFKSGDVYNTGCVFVYGITSILTSQPSPETRLCPDIQRGALIASKGARFGASIVNLGDINADGFEDIAVGAPYDGDGVGSIFIFYGYFPFSDMPTQVIHAKSFRIPNLRGFGSYMVGGRNLDIDGNGTPDLVVGAYESRHVVMLRTRPVARATVAITFHSANSQGGQGQILKFPPSERELRVRTCVDLSISIAGSQQKRLDIRLRFLMDQKLKRFDRGVVEQRHTMSTRDCVDQLYTASKEIIEGSEDLEFRVALWYNETFESPYDSPIRADFLLSPTQQTTSFSQDQSYRNAFSQFDPYLPAPFKIDSGQKLEIAADNCNEDGDSTCKPNLQLGLRLTFENIDGRRTEYNLINSKANRNPVIIGEVDRLILSISVGNIQETAYRPAIVVTMGLSDNLDLRESKSFLQFKWSYRSGRQKECNEKDDSLPGTQKTKLILLCFQSLHANGKMEYDWSMGNLRRLTVKDKNPLASLNFLVEAFPASDYESKVEKQFTIPLETQVDISASSMLAAEQTDIDPKKTYVDLFQTIQVKNSGFSATATDSVRIEISIPSHTHVKGNFTRVIGILDPSSSQSGLNVRCEGKFFNPSLELRDYKAKDSEFASDVEKSRSKRNSKVLGIKEPSKLVAEQTTIFSSDEDVMKLSGCDDSSTGSKSCEKITCFTDLPSKSSREIRLRMYMLPGPQNDLVKAEHLGIRVDSVIKVLYLNITVKTIMGRAERQFMHAAGIPAYVILLSVCGGTILFLLMTFALFKCGFFRRKTKEQLQQLKRQTMHMEVPQVPLNDQDDTEL